jgi:hypothetical protein
VEIRRVFNDAREGFAPVVGIGRAEEGGICAATAGHREQEGGDTMTSEVHRPHDPTYIE